MHDLKDRAQRVFTDLISHGDLTDCEQLIAEDYVDHRGGPPGRAGFVLGLQAVRRAFPDWTSTVADMLVDGDRVAARWTVRGTHDAEFMGIPATGKAIEMQECGILRFDDQGRLAELWRVADELTLLRQLGVLPQA